MKSERYTVEAKTGQAAPAAVMRGPMLQAVLEDRFKLKVRRVTREMPVYELVIAKSGAKVSPYTGHDCVIQDTSVWPPLAPPAGQGYCREQVRLNGDRIIREGVTTLDELASLLSFDRPVVNRTGITAPVSVRFEYSREDIMNVDPSGAPPASVVAALREQLGLDVRASTGPRDFLVIDHVERPTPNDAPASQAATFNPQTATPPPAPQFEVVSIKPDPSVGPPFITLVGDRWTAPYASAGRLVLLAYDVKPAQLVGLPTWARDTPFRIEAKLPANATAKDLPLMVQSMLNDRFHLVVHRESRTLKVRTITIAKEGLKLRAAAAACTTDPAEDDKLLLDRRRCGEMVDSAPPSNYTHGVVYQGFSVSMADIAAYFNRGADTLFVDETGVKGLYDVKVNLDYTPPSDMDPNQDSDDFTAYRRRVLLKAWQEQAGLVLDLDARQERVVPVLVIDHIERPTPNSPFAVVK